jgi:hypothetical protein
MHAVAEISSPWGERATAVIGCMGHAVGTGDGRSVRVLGIRIPSPGAGADRAADQDPPP